MGRQVSTGNATVEGRADSSARAGTLSATAGDVYRPQNISPPSSQSTTALNLDARDATPADLHGVTLAPRPITTASSHSSPDSHPAPPRQGSHHPDRSTVVTTAPLLPSTLSLSQATRIPGRQTPSLAQTPRFRSRTGPDSSVASTSARGRTVTVPHPVAISSSSSRPVARVESRNDYSALFAVDPGTSASSNSLIVQVRKEIVQLAVTGGYRIEARLEKTSTLPLLRRDRLPTSRSGLETFSRDAQPLVMPGITLEDHLDTFQRWQRFVCETGDVVFPICGITVARFLEAATDLDSGERPKMVWILEQYRKCTASAFDGAGSAGGWRHELVREWDVVDWSAWDRFLQLSQIRLGEWKVIEELAPPAPVDPAKSVGIATGDPRGAHSDSFAPRRVPLAAGSSEKARGKRRADEPSHPELASGSALLHGQPSGDSPVHPYGLNRQGQPRRKPFRRRKLPPDEQRADDAFYVAVRECMVALQRAKSSKMHLQVEPQRQGRSQPAVAFKTYPKPTVPPLRPYVPPILDPAPYSDYTPPVASWMSAYPEPILSSCSLRSRDDPRLARAAHDGPGLAFTLSSPSFSLFATSTPLPPEPSPVAPWSMGVISSDPDSLYPRFTFTPHLFLSYPKSLTLSSNLSLEDQVHTFKLAKDLRGHASIAQVEKVSDRWGLGADDTERRKKEALESLVKSAISAGVPSWVSIASGSSGVLEPREPEGARAARRRAADRAVGATRHESLPPIRQVLEGQDASSAAEDQSREGGATAAARAIAVPRKGKRKASEERNQRGQREEGMKEEAVEARAGGARTEVAAVDHSKQDPPSSHPQSVVSACEAPRSAPEVPTLSITTPAAVAVASSTTRLRRPSFNSVSISAPVVPQQIQGSRSKASSQEPPSKMRRRSSVTTPGNGVHPLAHLYAIQSPQFRQGARLKAATIVAATKSGIIPAAKSPLIAAKVLTEGAVLPKGSPRIGSSGSALAKTPRTLPKPLSPPLVPIPLQVESHGAESDGTTSPAGAEEATRDSAAAHYDGNATGPLSVSSTSSSALGVILKLPSPRQTFASTAARARTPPIPMQDGSPDPVPPQPPPSMGSLGPSDAHSTPTVVSSSSQVGGNHFSSNNRATTGLTSTLAPAASTPSLSGPLPVAATSTVGSHDVDRNPPSPGTARPRTIAVKAAVTRLGFEDEDRSMVSTGSRTVTPSLRPGPSTTTTSDVELARERVQETRSRGTGKARAMEVFVEVPPIARKDHPLRHVSKRVLSASEPVFPFGRLP